MTHPTPAPAACVLVDHGSRMREANEALALAAARIREVRPGLLVEVAHMELAPPSLGDAVDVCVAAGARTVVVVPWFLGPGRHSRDDIPRLAAEAAARHPGVTVRMAPPLGPDPALADLALRRFEEASTDIAP